MKLEECILITIALGALLVTFYAQDRQAEQQKNALNDLLKSQKTLFYHAADHMVYTYHQVGQVCYEDVKEGKVVSEECH